MNILSQEARERQAVVKLGLRKATLSELKELQAMVLEKSFFRLLYLRICVHWLTFSRKRRQIKFPGKK